MVAYDESVVWAVVLVFLSGKTINCKEKNLEHSFVLSDIWEDLLNWP